MPKDKPSHLPPEAQAAIDAAKKAAASDADQDKPITPRRPQPTVARPKPAVKPAAKPTVKPAARPVVKPRPSGTPRGASTIPQQAQEAMAKAKALAEEATKAAAEKKAAPRTYVVQAGDSLSKIAKELLGDAARWPEIFELNKDQIKDPNLIRVGQELRIPAPER